MMCSLLLLALLANPSLGKEEDSHVAVAVGANGHTYNDPDPHAYNSSDSKVALFSRDADILNNTEFLTYEDADTEDSPPDKKDKKEKGKDEKEKDKDKKKDKDKSDKDKNDKSPKPDKNESGTPCEWDKWSGWSPCSQTCGSGEKSRNRELAHAGDYCLTKKYQRAPCNTNPCPVDCEWNEWGLWSICSKSCGVGSSTRKRTKGVFASQGGAECDGDAEETKHCTEKECPIHCEWNEWETWSTCDKSCGTGARSRKREVRVAVKFGGNPCPGEAQQKGDCEDRACPESCEWSSWGDWNTCTDTCGGGSSSRVRFIMKNASFGGQDCSGSKYDTRECGTQKCPEDCKWDSWGHWHVCKKTCGNHSTYRERRVMHLASSGGRPCEGEHMEEKSCNLPECPKDCQWGPWSDFTSCSATCAGGNQTRSRKHLDEAQAGGVDCAGNFTEVRPCNSDHCPVDCKWEDWKEWDGCTKSCGNGTKFRKRAVVVFAAFGGKPCSEAEEPSQLQSCNPQPCPVDCTWSPWGMWGDCPVTCGGAFRTRSRTEHTKSAHGGKACVFHDKMEWEHCSANGCPVDCVWSDWNKWGACSNSCGNGTHIRMRNKTVVEANEGICKGEGQDTGDCNNGPCPIDCKFADWEAWGTCSKTCDMGTMTRIRKQISVPQYGGELCVGTTDESENCNTAACPVACVWDSWADWSPCSTFCGTGYKVRRRSELIKRQAGGLPCPGLAMETEDCATAACPEDCEMSDWSEWTNCTVTCGEGTQQRERSVKLEGSNGGSDCSHMDRKSTRPCLPGNCAVDCKWADWQEWNTCSVTCGIGAKQRIRQKAEARFNGAPCEGQDNEAQTCTQTPCPIDCKWQDWSDWVGCDVTCGHGIMVRTRGKTEPEQGGKACDGSDKESKACSKATCPGGNSTNPAPAAKLEELASGSDTVTEFLIDSSLKLNVTDAKSFIEDDDAMLAIRYSISHFARVPLSDVTLVSASEIPQPPQLAAHDETHRAVKAPSMKPVLVKAKVLTRNLQDFHHAIGSTGLLNMTTVVNLQMWQRASKYKAAVIHFAADGTDQSGKLFELTNDKTGMSGNFSQWVSLQENMRTIRAHNQMVVRRESHDSNLSSHTVVEQKSSDKKSPVPIKTTKSDKSSAVKYSCSCVFLALTRIMVAFNGMA